MWSLCQPQMFIRSRPGPLVRSADNIERLALPFQYGFLLILDNIRVLDRPRKEGAVIVAGENPDVARGLLRLRPTPTDSIFLPERVSRRSIKTYPQGLFDRLRGFVYLESSHTIAGVLVRIGSKEITGCVLFLGIKLSPGFSQPFRFCKVLSPSDWPKRPESLSRVLQTQKDYMRGSLESHAVDREEGYSVVINEAQEMHPGLIFLTYVHHE